MSHRALMPALAAVLFAFARPAAADPERAPQDYGAPKPDTTVGDVAIWAPRVALFPLWLVSEYGVRWPIGGLVKATEKTQWPGAIVTFFTFGERDQITFFPSALFDFGLLPSVGFNAGWKYFLTDPNTLQLHFGTWGSDWITARLVDKYEISKTEQIAIDTSFVNRQDNPIYGIGPRTTANEQFRYQSTTAEISAHYENRFWRSSSLEIHGGLRSLVFGDGTCCEERSLGTAVAQGALPSPSGFGQGYLAEFQRVALAVDSRRPRPAEGSGVRVEAYGEGDFVPESGPDADRRGWVKYGAAAGAALDITGTERVVSFELDAELADPLFGAIPFTDQVTLGGEQRMRGFIRNRLIDRSALVATVKYTWPIWVYLDGVIHADIGNVFGARFDGFEAGLLRMTSGIGIRSNGSRASGFELLVAGGTDPLEDGFKVTSFRFVIGSHHGF